MIQLILHSSVALACGLEGASTTKPLVKSYDLADVGTAHLIIESPGCPEFSPLRLTLVADCGGENLRIPIDSAEACSVKETDWQPEKGRLDVLYHESGTNCPIGAFGPAQKIALDLRHECAGGGK